MLDRSAAGFAVCLRRGVVGPRAAVVYPRTDLARRRDDDDPGPARGSTEGVPQVVGGDLPRVRWEIDERVDQRPASALLREIADYTVGVDAIGGTKIDHAEHGLVRKEPRRGQHGRVGRLERGPLRERVPRIVLRHAREFGAI